MSIAANLPPRAKRLSLRIADIGVSIPPRVQSFLDGPEVEALDGALAWGIEDIDSDSKLKLKWASGRLHDLYDLAVEGGHAEHTRYLPIATIGSETHMFAVDVTDPALAVYVFEGESGFKKWADAFDSFTKKLRRRGEKNPTEKLEAAFETAKTHGEAGNHAAVIEILTPVVARFPKTLTYNDDGRDELGVAYDLLGVAWKATKDLARATECFEVAVGLGCEAAGLNLCSLLLDHYKDYEKLVTLGEKQAKETWRGSDNHAWFQIRNYLGRGYLLTARPREAMRTYHQIAELAVEDPPRIREAVEALKALREDRPQADRDAIESILRWLDVPAPEMPAARLATLRAWWPALPPAVREAIREAINLEADTEPGDAELIRISRLTELTVTEAELTDISWVAQLEQLDELDLEENDITDLTPLSTLAALTDLDISNNKITSLRPLAKLTRLERLVADENPLTGLEGLEQLHDLEDLHVIQAGLESLEPLRGLRGLEDITIYENKLVDISPLADCPRLKQISSFTNPITKGLAALGKLPWLESVDVGDQSSFDDIKALRAANPFVSIDHWYSDNDNESVDVVHTPDPTARAWWDALPTIWKRRFAEDEIYCGKKEPDDEELQGLLREDSITIENHPLGNLEPIRKLARVDYLNFENTGVTDLSPLSRLPRLRDLLIRHNKIDLVSLAPAERLEELYMEGCGVSSLIGLERCRALREIRAEGNHVDDLRPLADLTELRVLDFEGNRVSDLAVVANLTKLRTLKLGLTRVTDLAPLARCKALRTLEVWCVPTLANALVLAGLPELTSVISHGSIPKADVEELRRRKPRLVID